MNDWHDAERRVERAQELFEQRKWQEALDELRTATRINPFNGSWFFNIGLILDEMRRFDEALEAYRQAVKIEATDLQSLNHLGVDLYRTGRLQQALRTFEQIEALDPSFEPAYCHRIITYSDMGDHDKAEEMFYSARLYKDQCPHCYYHIGCSLAARQLFNKAIYCFQKCLDLEPTHADAHVRLAESLWSKGDLEQARRHYLSDLRQSPGRTETLLDLGELLMEMGRSDEAGEKFRSAIELAPDDPAGYFCHGQWLVRTRRAAEAIPVFQKVLQLDPTFCGVHLELARLSFVAGNRPATKEHLRAELLLRPDDTQILMGLSNLWMDVDEPWTAIACLKRLIGHNADHVDAWSNLAVAQFQRGHYTEGIRSCHQALRIDPQNALTLYNLAIAHERKGEYAKGLHWVRKALERTPRDVTLQRLQQRLRLLRFKARLVLALRRLLHLPRR